MDVSRLLADLRAQRDLILQAIAVLERLALGGAKRRGRPPKWAQAIKAETGAQPAPAKKRSMNAETRKKMAEAQKKRWAAKKVKDS